MVKEIGSRLFKSLAMTCETFTFYYDTPQLVAGSFNYVGGYSRRYFLCRLIVEESYLLWSWSFLGYVIGLIVKIES
jgi:hypothetical protein